MINAKLLLLIVDDIATAKAEGENIRNFNRTFGNRTASITRDELAGLWRGRVTDEDPEGERDEEGDLPCEIIAEAQDANPHRLALQLLAALPDE